MLFSGHFAIYNFSVFSSVGNSFHIFTPPNSIRRLPYTLLYLGRFPTFLCENSEVCFGQTEDIVNFYHVTSATSLFRHFQTCHLRSFKWWLTPSLHLCAIPRTSDLSSVYGPHHDVSERAPPARTQPRRACRPSPLLAGKQHPAAFGCQQRLTQQWSLGEALPSALPTASS